MPFKQLWFKISSWIDFRKTYLEHRKITVQRLIDACVIYVWCNVGDSYYGEYPLAFAACFGYVEIYDYLIDHGADPNCKDSFGNNVLHMIVIANQKVLC